MGEIYKEKTNVTKRGDKTSNTTSVSIGEIVQEPLYPILFRDNEIDRVYNIMNKIQNRSVLIVGDHGCGKRSIVEGYVDKIKNDVDKNNVINIDFISIFRMASNRREFDENIKTIFSNINKDDNNVIFINNIGHLINFNCFENCGYVFINSLLKEIEDNGTRVIATATNKEMSEIETHFSKIIDYFTVLKLVELTKEQSIEIVKNDIENVENYFNIKLPENIAETICENADRYVKGVVFPKKGEELLDEVCAYISKKRCNLDDVKEFSELESELKDNLLESIKSGDYYESVEIDKKIENIGVEIEKINSNVEKIVVTNDDVLEAIGSIVNVPMTKLSKDKTVFLKNLPNEIKKDIIGQDELVDKIVKNIRRNQLGLRKKAHSAGNYIFIGSTGVGKTALAKSLAKNLFGSEENILRFDMSEFQTEIDVTKLLGSAPGYVGYKESGLLVKGLANKPECVCLFDEIEKAHPKIYDVLLQLLDEGTITGSDGKKVDGSKALIIFTSNIGVKSAKELSNPMGFSNNYEELKSKKEESIMRKALNKRFSPEFLNRLDSICYFNNLSRDVLEGILEKEMKEMNVGIKNIIHKDVVLSEDVKTWLLDKVEKENNGARPIIRLLEQEIEESVANLVIDESDILNVEGSVITATLEEDKIVLK